MKSFDVFLILVPLVWLVPGVDRYTWKLKEQRYWLYFFASAFICLPPVVNIFFSSDVPKVLAGALSLVLIFVWCVYFAKKKGSDFNNVIGIYSLIHVFVLVLFIIGIRSPFSIFWIHADYGLLLIALFSSNLFYRKKKVGVGNFKVHINLTDTVVILMPLFGIHFLLAEFMDLILNGDGMIFVSGDKLRRDNYGFIFSTLFYESIIFVFFIRNAVFAPLQPILETLPPPVKYLVFSLISAGIFMVFRENYSVSAFTHYVTLSLIIAPVFALTEFVLPAYLLFVFVRLFGYLIFGIAI